MVQLSDKRIGSYFQEPEPESVGQAVFLLDKQFTCRTYKLGHMSRYPELRGCGFEFRAGASRFSSFSCRKNELSPHLRIRAFDLFLIRVFQSDSDQNHYVMVIGGFNSSWSRYCFETDPFFFLGQTQTGPTFLFIGSIAVNTFVPGSVLRILLGSQIQYPYQ